MAPPSHAGASDASHEERGGPQRTYHKMVGSPNRHTDSAFMAQPCTALDAQPTVGGSRWKRFGRAPLGVYHRI